MSSSNLLTLIVGIAGSAITILHAELVRAGKLWTRSRFRIQAANNELLNLCLLSFMRGNLNPRMVTWIAESIARQAKVKRRDLLTHTELRNDLSAQLAASALVDANAQETLEALERRIPSLVREDEERAQRRLDLGRQTSLALMVGAIAAIATMLVQLGSPAPPDTVVLAGVVAFALFAAIATLRFAARISDLEAVVQQRNADEFNEEEAARTLEARTASPTVVVSTPNADNGDDSLSEAYQATKKR